MADTKTVKLYDSSTGTKQGWFSSSFATKGSSATITMTFNSSSFNEFKKIAGGLKITSVKLYIHCLKAGKGDKKWFQLTLSGGSAGASLGKFKSADAAYNRTTYLNLTDKKDAIQKWIVGGGNVIKSKDPDPNSQVFKTSSGTYSDSYAKVDDAYLEIVYVPSSDIEIENKLDINKSYTANIISNSTNYYHNVKLKVGDETFNLLKETNETTEKSTTFSFRPDKLISENEKTIAELMDVAATTIQGTIFIETWSGGSMIGDDSKTITVSIPDTCVPTIETTSYSLPSLIKEREHAFETDNFKLDATITSEYGATTSCNLYLNGIKKENINLNDSFLFSDFNIQEQKLYTIKLEVIDSRGRVAEKEIGSVFINLKSLVPTINKIVLHRTTNDGTVDDVNGTYCKATTIQTVISPIYNITGTEIITENKTFTMTQIVPVPEQPIIIPIVIDNVFEGQSYKTDTEYQLDFVVRDELRGTSSTPVRERIFSSSYLLHFRKKQNSVGVGCAAEAIGTNETGLIKFGWPTKGLQIRGNETKNILLDFTTIETVDGLRDQIFSGTGEIYVGNNNGSLRLLSNTTPTYKDKSILLSSDLFYEPEETVSFTTEYSTGGAELLHGYVSGSKRMLVFKVVLPKRLDHIKSIRIDSLTGNIRGSNGAYAHGSGDAGSYYANGFEYVRLLLKEGYNLSDGTVNPTRIIKDANGVSNSFIFALQKNVSTNSMPATELAAYDSLTNNAPLSFMLNKLEITFTDKTKEIQVSTGETTSDTVIIGYKKDATS